MRRGLVVALALISFTYASATGCSWTATIGRTDDLDNEAEIGHSDAEALYLRDRRGRIHRVERESVRSIDHPGNVEMLVGALLLGITGLFVYDYRDEGKSVAPLILIWGGTGGALILSGLARYIPSMRAAYAFESADPRPRPPEAPRPARAPSPPPRPAPVPVEGAPPAPPAPPPAQQDDEQPQVIPGAT